MKQSSSEDEEYIIKLYVEICQRGGKTSLSSLGINRATNVRGRLTTTLERWTGRYIRLEGAGYSRVIHALPQGTHEFQNKHLHKMYTILFAITRIYLHRSWSVNREQLEHDLPEAVVHLKQLGACKYVTIHEATSLQWNIPRIWDAVLRMPAHLKVAGAVPAVASAAVPAAAPASVPAAAREAAKPTNSRPSIPPVVQAGKTFKLPDGTRCQVVAEESELTAAVEEIRATLSKSKKTTTQQFVALDCSGVPEDLQLIQLATQDKAYIFDCQTIGKEACCRSLEPLLSAESPIKLVHDLHMSAVALERFGSICLAGALDTQLVGEHLWKKPFMGLNSFLSDLELPTHPTKEFVQAKTKSDGEIWTKRPIPYAVLEYAAMKASFLQAAASQLEDAMTQQDMQSLINASSARASNAISNDGIKAICFDTANDFTIASEELIRTMRPHDGFFGEILEMECNVDEILTLLPSHLKCKFGDEDGAIESRTKKLFGFPKRREEDEKEELQETLPVDQLSDIVLDFGRRPQCWIDDERHFLCDDGSKLIQKSELDDVSCRLGNFGTDNRAGLDGKLHRFSAMRDRTGHMMGITIRVGRHIRGNAAMLMDLLLGSDKSILILGEPGSGKTTIVREATRKLAEYKNVIVVDTSNEIAGDGLIPNSCIGLARRMMVPSLDQQSAVMVECVQNHTPHVMVIDEIGRPKEVQAARTVKQRGVRMIASAHGDLRRLLKNKDLVGLIGGIEHVTIGDEMAREEAKRKQQSTISKTKAQRGGEPTFDIIVEVRRGARHEWTIVDNSAQAVDDILEGLKYKAQLRTRDPETGLMTMEFIDG